MTDKERALYLAHKPVKVIAVNHDPFGGKCLWGLLKEIQIK